MDDNKQNINNQEDILNNLLIRFNKAETLMRNGSAVPTYIPKTFFEQFYIYESGITRRLYVYINATWVALSE